MNWYKKAQLTKRFVDKSGKSFYIHHDQPCVICGKKSDKDEFTYEYIYKCEDCGGNKVEFSGTDIYNLRGYVNPTYVQNDDWSGSWDNSVKHLEEASVYKYIIKDNYELV